MKQSLLSMRLSEAPLWWILILFGTTISWILMWVAKAYVGVLLSYFFFGMWATGTVGFFITLIFFQYQEPRKK